MPEFQQDSLSFTYKTGHMWHFNENDRTVAEKLSDFISDKVFDIHAHIWRVNDLGLTEPSVFSEGPSDVSVEVWRENVGKFLPQKELHGGLLFPVPAKNADVVKCNDYLISQLGKEPVIRGLALVSPDSNPEYLSALLKQPGIAGMKPYHLYSKEHDSWNSSVRGYLPEWQLELANEHGSVIMLHLVKDKAIADPDNVRDIREICTRYPDIKVVLAHAARCFHSPHAKEGINKLRGLQNIWFDTSAVCEPESIITILREFGPRKLMWGSDFPVSQIRGKSVSIGDGFAWIDESLCDWEKAKFTNPVLVGLESLIALRSAAEEFGLNSTDIQDIFFENAMRLLHQDNDQGKITQQLYRHAKDRITGGVQLLSKRPENMAPDIWPAYFREARGCEVWDLDGKHYYDMATNGIGACLLGFSDPDINSAIRRRINLGSMCSLNPPEEVELADLLCEIHPWAEQARFTRSGGEACAVAVRIARAATDRSIIAVCGYHGWHDWYLAANLGENDALRGHLLPGLDPLGVPVELRGTALSFNYNDKEGLQSIIDKSGSRLAAVIMEPCRQNDPEPGFLQFVRDETKRCGSLLIFDEITIGWRLHTGGAHMALGVVPDIAVFAKSLGNGYPIGAVIGTKAAMAGANSSFISSTYWTEGIGPAAAIATLNKMKTLDIPAYIADIGEKIISAWKGSGKRYGLPVTAGGYPCLAHFSFQHNESEKLRTIYTRMMLKRGFLAGLSIYPTMAHNSEIAGLYTKAIDEVFEIIASELHHGSIDKLLDGKVALSGFARLTK